MKIVNKCAAQGDVLFRRVTEIPKTAVEQKRTGDLVVAHSETGHHHSIADKAVTAFAEPGDSLTCYLRMDSGIDAVGGVDVVHHRAWDTHETIRLLGKPGDVWQVRRQREWTPEGWRRVED
jgi:hypothetical protein